MEKILEILRDIRSDVDWENENDIIESGLIDSFDMITLIGELNEAFGVGIGLEQLEPENFSSPGAIAAMLKKLGADV
jgi:acyl carrier protein